MNRQTVLTVDW